MSVFSTFSFVATFRSSFLCYKLLDKSHFSFYFLLSSVLFWINIVLGPKFAVAMVSADLPGKSCTVVIHDTQLVAIIVHVYGVSKNPKKISELSL